MATILRDETNGYTASYGTSPVSAIANQVKDVPDAYINEAGNGVTEACIRYLRPLIMGEVSPEYKDGLPVHCIL
jgi:6-phosphofructokinase 1